MENFDLKKFLVENRLTTNSKILLERRLALTPDEINIVNRVATAIAAEFESGQGNKNTRYNLGTWNYTLADGSPGKISFISSYVDDDSLGTHYRREEANLEDNIININSKPFIPAFDGFFTNIWQGLTGDSPLELLKKTITHELIHAKDPAVNHHPIREPYDSDKIEVYYKSWAEFPTMTGQFMEAIIRRTNELISEGITKESYNTIQRGLQSILDLYSGKKQYFEDDAYKLIAGHAKGLMRLITELVILIGIGLTGANAQGLGMSSSLDVMQAAIQNIKKYHIEAYNEFLKDLYLTVQEAVDNVNKNLPEGFPPMEVGGRGSYKTSFKGNK